MCGIVGIVGKSNACKIVLDVLKKLEYRGYDSSGLAFIYNNELKHIKAIGKLSKLIDKFNPLSKKLVNISLAIGHTRWATHGKVIEENAHPIISKNIAVVHNGIIENFEIIKKDLIKNNFIFKGTTDTEVIPHLLNHFLNMGKSFFEASKNVLKSIEGAYAFSIINSEKNEIFVSRKTSPLALGIGENFNLVCSDAQSISTLVNKVIYLEDGDYAFISANKFEIYNQDDKKVFRQMINIKSNFNLINKDGYRHFMEKEIFEQPNVLKNTIGSLIENNSELNISPEKMGFKKGSGIIICAAGTSHYAAMIGKYWIERFASIPVSIELSSEFRYRKPVTSNFSTMIAISQSGESIDTLMAMREAKKLNLATMAIVNVENSTIDREADYSLYTNVGTEIGVASTKSFTSQLIVLLMIAFRLALYNKKIDRKYLSEFISNIKIIPLFLSKILSLNDQFLNVALSIKNKKNVLYLGRGVLYPLALEGALKLKEISYIHSEGFAAGDMKHGPIALIEEDLPIIMFLTTDGFEEKSISNLQEASARGGKVFLIADEEACKNVTYLSNVIKIPYFNKNWNDIFSPIFLSIPAHLIAYHVGRERGTDVDQPRNLAKSVTVE